MLHGFIRDPHFFTSVILPANILLSYVNTTKFPEHRFRSSLFCFLYPDVYHFAILFVLLSQLSVRNPPVILIVPLIHLPVHNPPVPQPTPTAHIQHKVFRSRTMNYWTLTSFLCLPYISLLTLPASCTQLLSGLCIAVDSIKLNCSLRSTIILPTYKILPPPAPLWNLFWYSDIIQNSFVYTLLQIYLSISF